MKLTQEERKRIRAGLVMVPWTFPTPDAFTDILEVVDEVLEAREKVPQAPHCINCLRKDDTARECHMCRGLDMSTFHAYALSAWRRLQAESAKTTAIERRARLEGKGVQHEGPCVDCPQCREFWEMDKAHAVADAVRRAKLEGKAEGLESALHKWSLGRDRPHYRGRSKEFCYQFWIWLKESSAACHTQRDAIVESLESEAPE